MKPAMTIGLIGSLNVATGCTSIDVQPDADAPGTYGMSLNLGLLQNWTDPEAGRATALRAAQETCDLPAETSTDMLDLTRGPALYNFRGYRFACPVLGEATQ